MVKIAHKNKPLEDGQKLWLQGISRYIEREDSLREVEVVKTNKTSAYIAYVERDKKSDLTYRVNQKTREVYAPYSVGYGYVLWESKEQYEYYKSQQKKKAEYRKIAMEKVKNMTLNELEKFIETY